MIGSPYTLRLSGGISIRLRTGAGLSPAADYFFIQSPSEDVRPVGPGEGLALLVESSEQASRTMVRGRSPEEKRAFRRERFEILAGIARDVPVHHLRLSKNGFFWKEIERTLPR